ncbi:MAG: hypothetical protein F2747_06630 [Actinobacteria bacterium]|nr:hypothetical protein [Actinomycetota bacterium]MSX73932.1 hypothetical protein [Actinomycetota bacterium]MSZ01771.1 hypothetical protein [Actinomycetota bacterium]
MNLWIDTKMPEYMPSYAQVANLIGDGFPDAELRIQALGDNAEFTLYLNDELLLTINNIGWTFTTGDRDGKWSEIKEGSVESVARHILSKFADRDFKVYDPVRPRGSVGAWEKRVIKKRTKLIRPKKGEK